MKEVLLSKVMDVLHEGGFVLSERCNTKSFDFAARREDVLLLVKVLRNIDAFGEAAAIGIKRAAFCLLASPLLVGERKGAFPLEDGVVYRRHGVVAVNVNTLRDYFVMHIRPYVYCAPGGLYVNIDGEEMRRARERKDLSLGDVASELGLSRRCVRKYEEGMSTNIEVALKMEELLETMLIKPLEITQRVCDAEIPKNLSDISNLERYVLCMMTRLGFNVFETIHTPFRAVSQHELDKILTGVLRSTKNIIRRAKIVGSISYVTKTKSVLIVSGNVEHESLSNTAVIRKDELEQMRDVDDFTDVVEERLKSEGRMGALGS
ncbi:transcriptional regulator [Candidatus Alkanophaga liquidiphilum]|nr:MAG: transcriptional regulator [Candidatus Alkanophagales archaeon]